jgi:hypothetical protein
MAQTTAERKAVGCTGGAMKSQPGRHQLKEKIRHAF